MVAVVGAACLSGLGVSWRGLGRQMQASAGPITGEVAVGQLEPTRPKAERLAQRLMSRSALAGSHGGAGRSRRCGLGPR